jgi:group I intron endonuclease
VGGYCRRVIETKIGRLITALALNKRFLVENYTVYKHTNLVNGRVYIGITGGQVEKRWLNGAGYKNNSHFWRAIQKYGWDSFSHEILYSGLSRTEAQAREVELISFYRNESKGCYNILPGGDLGRTGVPVSEETREKLRKINLGRVFTAEQRRRMSEAGKGKIIPLSARQKMSTNNARYWLGKKRSEDTIEKNRQAHLGKTLTPEHRAKISASSPREKLSECKRKRVLQMDLEGNPIKVWSSMKEAEQALIGRLTGQVSSCCNGKSKTAFGYKWKITHDKGE